MTKTLRFLSKIAVLTACLIGCLRPVGPAIGYWLNYNYISTVLCVNRDKPEKHCHGKCYLKMSMEEYLDIAAPSSVGITQSNAPIHWDQIMTPNAHLAPVMRIHKFNIFLTIPLLRSVTEPPFIPPEA